MSEQKTVSERRPGEAGEEKDLAALSTTGFLSLLRSRGILLRAEEEQLRFQAPRGVLTPALRRELKLRKTDLLAFLKQASSGRESSLPPVERIPRGAAGFPLSFAQTRLWFIAQMEPESPVYNIPVGVRMEGELDADCLERAFREVVHRHEVLRTTFLTASDDEPLQVVAEHPELPLAKVDLRSLPPGAREEEARRRTAAEALRPFDLAAGPLVRALLLRLAPCDHLLLFTMHHIVSDAWSGAIVVREVAALYTAFSRGEPSPLPELPVQYADFALWQRQIFGGEWLDAQLAYWRRQLAGSPELLELPTDRPRPAVETWEGGRRGVTLPAALRDRLQDLSQHHGATLFMTLVAAYGALLSRISGQREVLIGTPIAGRRRPELEPLIGFFLNTLVLRIDLTGDPPSFAALLDRTRQVTLSAFENQDLPFERLVEEMQPARNLSHSPLFQAMLIFQNVPSSAARMPGLEVRRMPPAADTSPYDLTFSLVEMPEGLRGSVRYRKALFDPTTIDRLIGHLKNLLREVVEEPDRRLSELPLLSAAQRHQLLWEWSAPMAAADGAPAERLERWIEARVERAPDAVAVVFRDQALSYRELDRRAGRLARRLIRLGVGPEVPVGICLERSLEILVGVLGILKAGGAYLPLDPSFPRERLAFMVADSGAPVLLTRRELLEKDLPAPSVLCVDGPDAFGPGEGEASAAGGVATGRASADNLAYVIYTSGSTGRPKGVQVTHRTLVTFLQAMARRPGLTADDALMAVTTLSFDIAALELFLPLVVGGRLEIASRDLAADGEGLARRLAASRIDVLQATPMTWRLLLEAGWQAAEPFAILCGGEALPEDLARRLLASGEHRLWNLYGPTETTVWSAVEEVRRGDGPISIGRPIAGTRIYLSDRGGSSSLVPLRGNTIPPGVAGELLIGGAGVTRGYLGRPGLTAESFAPDPFGPAGSRLYRTGDLVRQRADGKAEFLGRIDHQIKVRGFRIELGEIETALGRSPGVRECVVLARREDGQAGDTRLVAYLVPGEPPPEVRELRARLKDSLPEYMVPSAFELLAELPRLPNGKVDRPALARRPLTATSPAGLAAARDPGEELLAGIWAEVLGRDGVGIDENFFDIGGHSLLATQVLSRVRQLFRVELPLRGIFSAPTVAEMARSIAEARRSAGGATAPPIVPVERGEALPLSFAQQRLWFLDQLEPDSPAYNIPAAARLAGALEPALLERVLNEVVRRHEALRTRFVLAGEQPVQRIAGELVLPLPRIDLGALPGDHREREARRLAVAEEGRAFDLARGPLIRFALLRLAPEDHLVLVTMHHIISDEWSVGVFLWELTTLYRAFSQGEPSPLAELPVHYGDFSHWQRRWLTDEVLEFQLDYWRGQLAGAPQRAQLPTDRPRPALQTYRGKTRPVALSAALTDRLAKLSRERGATLYMTLLAAFKVLLHRLSGQDDVVVGSPIAGRNRREIEGLIGFFVNTLVLRTDLSAPEGGGELTFSQLLERVRKVALEAYEHQDLPFERLVEDLRPERDLSASPLFQVMFMLQNAPREVLEVKGLSFLPLERARETARFDLTLGFQETADGLRGSLEYNTDLFDASTVGRWLAQFERLLQGIVEDPAAELSRLPLLSAAERHQVVSEWDDTAATPTQEPLHELFALRAERTPDAVAVVCDDASSGGQASSYAELDRRSDLLAGWLRRHGIGAESLIGIALEPAPELPVALLGVLKAGASYLPLDPSYPPDRLTYMLEDSGAALVITQERLLAQHPFAARCLVLDRDWAAISADGGGERRRFAVPAESLAYVIYTSGSTGKPKGVAIPHRALVNFLLSMGRRPGLSPGDRMLAVTPLSFDISALELFLPWIVGAQVELVSRETAADGERLQERLLSATVLQATPSTWQLLLATGWSGGGHLKALCGGEALTPRLAAQLAARTGSTWNMYGPTETTVWSSLQPVAPEVAAEAGAAVPIGRPIANTRFQVVDRALRVQPVGAPGELLIGGSGLARGYFGRPGLAAERFVPDPFAADPGERLYRTGDLVRWRRDGGMDFLGRPDHQIKLRGFRIELGEIEVRLTGHPAVSEAVVALVGSGSEARLVAWVVAGEGDREGEIDSWELRRHLREYVPDYMVPSAFVELTALPRLPNGKVDRRSLPAPEGGRQQLGTAYAPPGSDLEQSIAEIWQEVLGLEKVGLDDNFFDAGGHSLLLVQVRARISELIGRDFPLMQLFRYPTIRTFTEHLRQGEGGRVAAPAIAVRREPELAVIGMACRFPGSEGLDEYWQNLCDGVENIRYVTDEELAAAGLTPAIWNRDDYVRAGAPFPQPEYFDAGFFGFSPREAEVIDPQQRIFLECAYHTLENAGYDPARYRGRIAVFAGSGLVQYARNVFGNRRIAQTVGGHTLTFSVGQDFLATRVSYKLNLTGPAMCVQTACSTSLTAIHMARRCLLDDECDMAIAGGVTVRDYYPAGYVFVEGGIRSPDGHCRAFDARARGTVFTDGVGAVLLKRLSDALADGDNVRAVVKGSAINNDGSLKIGYTAPSVPGQEKVIRNAHLAAGVNPETITYVETHGTGTTLGDPIEVEALTHAFRAGTDKKGFCAIGSVKTNIGHTDAAAGVAGFIKSTLAVQSGLLPPSLFIEEPNPEIDFASSPFYVQARLERWNPDAGVRRAGVSGFGVGGTNVHAILEQPPEIEPSGPSRPYQLLVFSARSKKALEAMTENLASHLRGLAAEERPADEGLAALADVAYTLHVGRGAYEHRRALVCRDADEAAAALAEEDRKVVWSRRLTRGDAAPPVAFLFPGQGAQYAGMGRDLYASEAVFRDELDICCELLEPHLGRDLRPLLLPSAEDEEAAGDELRQTWLTQPALFAVEYALARQWAAWGIRPEAMIGHSIGEYVAATLASVFSLEEAAALVAARGQLMQETEPGAMLSISLAAEEVVPMLGDELALAAINAPSSCVVSGRAEAVDALADKLASRQVASTRLVTSHAFHSPLMEPILGRFRARLRQVALKPPRIPFLSNLTGSWIRPEEATDPDYWVRHLRGTVRFTEGMAELLSQPQRVLLEVGPGRTLRTLARRQDREAGERTFCSLRHPRDRQDDRAFLLGALGRLWLAGVEVDWEGFHGAERRLRTVLPNYPFQRQRFWVAADETISVLGLPPDVRKQASVTDWFWEPYWKASTPPPPFTSASADGDRRWLLFADSCGVAAEMDRQLVAAGCEGITVEAGEAFARLAPRRYSIRPGESGDYEALLAELGGTEGAAAIPRRIAHLWSVTAGGAPEDPRTAPEMLEPGFYGLLWLAQALGKHQVTEPVRLGVVASGLWSVDGDEALWPEKAALLGPSLVIPHEYVNVRASAIDVAVSGGGAAARSELAGLLLAEIAGELSDPVVAYRGRSRRVQEYAAMKYDQAVDERLPLRRRGVYLITGGLGGLGLVVARYLAESFQARLALVGRSPFPDAGEWPAWIAEHGEEDATSGRIRQLQALEEMGSEVLVLAADVADEEAMDRVVKQTRERFGELHGVMHAAGIPGGGVIQLKEREVAAAVLAPKVRGTRVLETVLADSPPEMLVLFSSITAVRGAFGQVDYCAANNVLDAFARDLRRRWPETRIVAIGWGPWEEVGMAADAGVSRTGSASKAAPQAGTEAGTSEAGTSEAGTSEAGTPDGGQAVAETIHPLLDRCVENTPQRVEFRTELRAWEHWVLAEHKIMGTPTVPGATYMEMGRAAFEHVTGQPTCQLSEILFLTPMMVAEGERREVRTLLVKDGEGLEFSVASRVDQGGEGSWQLHSQGRLGPSQEEAQSYELEALAARCTGGMEERAPSGGPDMVQVGPRWGLLKDVQLGDGEGLARLELPAEYRGDLDRMVLHPSMLDVATGLARGLVGGQEFLPLSYGKLVVRHPFTDKVHAYIRKHGEQAIRAETFTVDLSILDDSGRELAAIEQFTMKRVGEAAAEGLRSGPPAAEDAEERTAVGDGILPAEGVEALRRVLSRHGGPQIVVSPNDLMALFRAQLRARSEEGEEDDGGAPGEVHERPEMSTDYVAPRSELEERMAEVWQQTLAIEKIGMDDDFFELGGDSLLATQMFSRLQKSLGVNLSLPAIFEAPTIGQLSASVELEAGAPAAGGPAAGGPAAGGPAAEEHPLVAGLRPRELPLSFAQERLWFLAQMEPESAAHNLPMAWRMRGPLHLAALERGLGEIVRRHETLRTTFAQGSAGPVQIIAPPEPFDLELVDLSGLGAGAEAEAARQARSVTGRPFDLACDRMIRVRLLRLGADDHLLVVTMHHIASDYWSYMLFLRELTVLYAAFAAGAAPSLSEPEIQYADFAIWQRGWLSDERLEEQAAYWKDQLGGELPVLELPTDRPRPPVETHRGARRQVFLDSGLRSQIEDLSRGQGVTPFMTLLAIFQVLLSRYSGQDDLIVGSPVAGRTRPEVEGLMGVFINNLALRVDLGGDPEFQQLLQRVRETTLQAFAHQDLPFERLVEILQPRRDLSRPPIYQVTFTLHNVSSEGLGEGLMGEEGAGLSMDVVATEIGMALFDLSLSLSEIDDDLRGFFEYNCDLFDATTIGRMAAQLRRLAGSVVADPAQRLSRLPLLAAAERHQLESEWSAPAAKPAEATGSPWLPSLIDAWVERTPDAVAVLGDQSPGQPGEVLRYAELGRQAALLAGWLRRCGFGPESLAGIALEPAPELVVALLAVLEAGGAYLPLDPALPRQRLEYMVEDSAASALLTREHLRAKLPPVSGPCLCLDDGWQTAAGEATAGEAPPRPAPAADSLAYVTYTSGSTGRPKGVQITHRSLVNFLLSMRRRPGLEAADRVLAVTSLSFDISALELFLPLITGASVELVSRETAADGALLADRVRESTVVQATPATWRLLLAGGWTGAADLKVLCGGEALTPSLAAELLARSASGWNMYGPTETTVWSSVHAVGAEPGDAAAVSIGRPIDRTDLRVVDRGLQTQPIGVLGELLIGGAGLSRGYRGRPALTAERFVPDPFGARPGERLYRTGDLARWGGAGRLDFHGRLDHQIKVRGFRIEPGEIEAVLGEHPQVRAAAVVAREDVPGLSAPGEPLLAAYVVAAAEIAELRRFLRERLPDYMVPKAFAKLEELPLTPSGKVDRASLPRPEGPSSVAELVPPRSSREELLVEIWRQVLGFSGQLGVHDNFFDIGGHSLLATRMVSQIREFFGVELPVRAVFEAPTVAGLAEHLEAPGAVASAQPIALAERSEELPLSYSQLREWFLYQLEPGNPAYHIPATIELRGPLDYRMFERSCNEVVRRHETLRTTFRPATAEAGTASVIDGAPSGGQPVVQVIAPRRDLRVPVVDLTALPAEPRAAVARRLAAAVILLPFDLVNGPLVRIGLLRVGPREHTVCLAMHHIISDAWSMGLLIREVTELYGAYLAGRPSPLPDLKVQYADYVIAQRRWLRGETLERLVSYWRQRLAEEPPVLRLPVDRPRTARTIPRSEWWPLAFDAETTAEIRDLCQRSRTSLFMTSLAAFQTLLGRTTGQDDVAVGTFIAGRNRPEIEPLIGFFVNSLVLRSDLSGEPSFRELLKQVREVTLGAYEHQDLPFEMLLDRLQIERSLSHTPLFQVMLAMQNLPTYNRQQEGLSLIPVGVGGQRSQFELTLWLEESDGVLSGNMEYNAESFDPTTVRRICGHFQALLRGAVKDPDQPISTLPLMGRGERQQLLCEWSRTPDSVTGEPSFQELFEAQVSRVPDAPALFDPTTGEELSYRQLDERSNRLAHHLRRLGVASESLVGLLLARSCDLVVGILGILKAGGAYVPLDPDYPRERLKLIAQDARVALLLTHRQLAGELLELAGGDPAVVAMDLDGERIAACPADPPPPAAGGSAAYVSYTSGSTGRPKGVVVSHRSLAWYAAAAIEHYGLVAEDRVLQLSSISFDISVEEIFPCLARGATLVLRRDETIASADEFYRDCRDWGITVAAPPTAFWHELAVAGTGDRPPSLRLMSVGGERMLPQRVADWRRSWDPAVQLMNTYGPTETTVVATLYKVAGGTDGFRGEVPIGRPVPRAEVYVLDGDGRMLPSGAVGELCIGGDGVARGYLGQGAATAERFVPHPWAQVPGERLYRTGDLARFAGDGNLQFLGRTDHQVKIRGFRVEPGEIEALIVRHPGVRDAAVVAFEPQPAQRRLAAYVVPRDAEIAAGELRDFLATSLPEHMVPAVYVTLETLPLTPGGKVDRRALPEPDQPGGGGAEHVAPSTPSEEILAEILCELLGVERVSVYDSFFDLGGHSLLATQYRSRIREAFEVELPLQAFFETPSIARLAVRIEELILAELEAEADDA